METATRAPATATRARYIPRGRNQLHTIFGRHLQEFCDLSDERYAAKYGMFRLERIRYIGERFLTFEDYRLGVARIRCTNPACGHDYFNSIRFTDAKGKENVHLFDALEFLAELTQHIPPRRVQLIRRYGLYSSRTKGRWSQMPHVAARAPEGWRASHASEAFVLDDPGFEPLDDGEEVAMDVRKRAWARLLAKVYEIDPLVCPKCGSEMKVIAVIQDPFEIRDILTHLVKTGRAPPGLIRPS